MRIDGAIPSTAAAKVALRTGLCMPRRIGISQGIVSHIRVAVEALRIARTQHDRIGRLEPAAARLVETRAVVVQPEARLAALAGEAILGAQAAPAAARAAVGIVARLAGSRPGRVRGQGGRVEVVAVQVRSLSAPDGSTPQLFLLFVLLPQRFVALQPVAAQEV